MSPDRVQQFGGTPVTEVECYFRALEHLNAAINCLRGLAHHRKDTRWVGLAKVVEGVIAAAKRGITKGGPRITTWRQ